MTITINPGDTLAVLVDNHPDLAGELEKRGLDYCCGGGRTLADACAERGLDGSVVAEELAGAAVAGERGDWTAMTAGELVDHLEAVHHRYLWEEMPRLTALVDKITTVHGDRHPELSQVSSLYAALRAELEQHLQKEERVLFPMIRDLAESDHAPEFHCGTLRNPISVMLSEHDVAGDLLARLHQLTGGYHTPADGCASYAACYRGLAELEADTHLHIHKENNVLFPMVVRLEAERQPA